jgi:hypothetical protein
VSPYDALCGGWSVMAASSTRLAAPVLFRLAVGDTPPGDEGCSASLVCSPRDTICLTVYHVSIIFSSMIEVVTTDEWKAWYEGLDAQADDAVTASVDALATFGVDLGHPRTSAIKGSKVALRELRIKAGGRPLRTFYIFDIERQAVLLIGGDKTGDEKFYERLIPLAEAIWSQYQKERTGR